MDINATNQYSTTRKSVTLTIAHKLGKITVEIPKLLPHILVSPNIHYYNPFTKLKVAEAFTNIAMPYTWVKESDLYYVLRLLSMDKAKALKIMQIKFHKQWGMYMTR